MKKILLSLCLALVGLTSQAAVSANDFQYDETAVIAEFQEVTELENTLLANNFSLNAAPESPALAGYLSAMATPTPFSIDDMDWTAFAWGFCCWPVGFFVVAINNNKTSDQKLSFWIGMGVSVVVSAISYLANPNPLGNTGL